jgi:hypothetical protein
VKVKLLEAGEGIAVMSFCLFRLPNEPKFWSKFKLEVGILQRF